MIKAECTSGGIDYLIIENESARAKIALQGAHIFSYQVKEQRELLWVSDESSFKEGEAIRGGIPICWPWFGEHSSDKSLPKHGFARISKWEVESTKESDSSITEITMSLTNSELMPYKFKLLAHFTIGKTLSLSLTTENLDDKAFTISQALHTYFAVEKIENVRVNGLDGLNFIDFTNESKHIQNGDVTIENEVDRIYEDVKYPLFLYDNKRLITINSAGSKSSVVWNPWEDKCKQMSSMKEDDYRYFVCVETTNTRQDEQRVEPSSSYTISATYSIG